MKDDTSRFSKIAEKIKSDGKIRFALIAVCALILIIAVCVGIFGNKKTEVVSSDTVSEYINGLERKLENLLSKVEGAGRVSVAINVESGMETVLAVSTTVKEGSNGRETTTSPILVNGKTVVLKELYPKISGVLIVCEGADKIMVYTRIQQATLSLLDIDVNRVEILAMR